MKKSIKKISVLLMLLCSIAAVCVRVQADPADPEISCQMDVSLMYEHVSLPDREVVLYRVADLEMESQTFTVLEQYRSDISDSDMEGLDIAKNNEAVSLKFLGLFENMNVEPDFSGVSEEDGICKFSGLKAGLYLIDVEEKDDIEVTPGLISVPQYSEEDGEWIFSVNVEPKMARNEPDKPVVTPKPTVSPTPVPMPTLTPAAVKNTVNTPVKTGDESAPEIYIILLAMAAGILIFILYARAKVRGREDRNE